MKASHLTYFSVVLVSSLGFGCQTAKTLRLLPILIRELKGYLWTVGTAQGPGQVHSLLKQTHCLCSTGVTVGSVVASPGELYIGGQEHFYMETHCTIAVPKGEAGEMELFASTQNAMKTQVGVQQVNKGPGERETWAGPGGNVRVVV